MTEPIVVTPPKTQAIKLGRQFLLTFAAKGGLAPYTWTGVGLPDGIGRRSGDRTQSAGDPSAAGTVPITVEVTDALGTKQRGTATVTVATALQIATTQLPVGHAGRRFSGHDRDDRRGRPGRVPPRRSQALRGSRSTQPPATCPAPPSSTHGSHASSSRRTGKHVRRIVVERPPLPAAYSLYVTATDALGQRSTTRLRLTVKP